MAKVKYYDTTGKSYDGYNIGGKTYKDEAGTQRIDKGSYVQTGDNWYQMGDNGGTKVNTPEFAGGWIGDVKASTPSTKKSNTPKTFDDYGGDYSNMLGNMTYPTGVSKEIKQTQSQIGDLISALQTYQNADSISMDESNARANAQLNNIYNANLDKTLANYNKDAVSRGMFGQLPIEALKASAISDSEVNKASAIGDLANSLYTNDFNMARQKDQDFYNRQNSLLNALGQDYSINSDIMNTNKNDFMNVSNLANNQNAQKQQEMADRLNMLGYADQLTADYFNVPIGTPSQQINLLNIQQDQSKDMLDYQQELNKDMAAYENELSRQLASYNASLKANSSSKSDDTPKEWTAKDSASLFKDASDLAKTLATLNKSNSDTGEFGSMAESAGVDPNKKEYTEADIQKLYYYLYQLYNTDPADAMLLEELQKSQNLSEPTFYSNPATSLLRNYLK